MRVKKIAEENRKKYRKETKDMARLLMAESPAERIDRKVKKAHERIDLFYSTKNEDGEPGSNYDGSGYPIRLPKRL
jgi:hypothetical protein